MPIQRGQTVVTMNDIAKKAGISRTAVSKILNHKGDKLAAATRERVLQAAQELNYRPNYFARSLKVGKTNCIGLMGSLTIADFNAPYFAQLTGSIETAMVEQKSRHSLLIFGANFDETYDKSVELIKKGLVDGLILIILAKDLPQFEARLLPILRSLQLPFVVVHSLSREMPYHNVGLDTSLMGDLVVRHLHALGHRELWLYLEGEIYLHDEEMYAGFKKALTNAGLPWDSDKYFIRPPDMEARTTYDRAYRTFRVLPELPRALFTSHEEAAYGILDALRDRGVRLPDRVALVGAASSKDIPNYRSDLTTIYNPVEEKGAAAVQMLLSILQGKRGRNEICRTILKPELIVRRTG